MTQSFEMPTSKRPIGFWIRAADRALDRAVDDAHAAQGFTRRRWQVLSLIVQSEPATVADLAAEMALMMTEDALGAEIETLKEKQLIDDADSVLSTTEAGQEMHRQLAARQVEVRKDAMAGIHPEDYEATLRCLSQITENLTRR